LRASFDKYLWRKAKLILARTSVVYFCPRIWILLLALHSNHSIPAEVKQRISPNSKVSQER
jgi:hypothetical protein